MQNVLMFTTPDGGIGQYSYCLGNALAQHGLHVKTLVQNHPAYDMRSFAHAAGYKVVPHLQQPRNKLERLTVPWMNLASFAWHAKRANIFHSQWVNGPRFDQANWANMRRLGLAIVQTLHDVLPHERQKVDVDHNIWLARNADAVIVHGNGLKQLLLEMTGVAEDRVHVLPHGNFNILADEQKKWDRVSARRSFGFSDEEQVLLFFGYIRPYKGLDTLIDAAKLLLDRGGAAAKSMRLLIAGRTLWDFWNQGNYADRIETFGLTSRTTYAIEYIAMEDVGRYFHAADAIVMPYKSGSQSGILQMAYAYAKPVVVTNVGSIAECIDEGRTGLVIPPNNPEALAWALDRLLNCPEAGRLMGQSGREYATTQLSWDRIASKTMALYQQMD